MAGHTARLRRNIAQVLACLVCLQACTSTHQNRLASGAISENLPSASELTDTPFNPQTEHHCGPAALATVLQYHGADATPQQLVPYLYIPERKGSLQIEMAATTRRFGMLPYPLEPDLEPLLTEIAAGNPVLVLQNLGFGWWPRWHYAVVVGYDLASDELVLRSGTSERWQTTFSVFAKTWKRADNWALVIVPAGEIPATASLTSFLKTAYAFEETGLVDYALNAYQGATQRWNDAATSWLALGTLAYQTGNIDQAVSALHKAAQLNPENINAWNNFAYALHASGCETQARESLRCARRISPDDQNIRDSEQEIEHLALQRKAEQCPAIACE